MIVRGELTASPAKREKRRGKKLAAFNALRSGLKEKRGTRADMGRKKK